MPAAMAPPTSRPFIEPSDETTPPRSPFAAAPLRSSSELPRPPKAPLAPCAPLSASLTDLPKPSMLFAQPSALCSASSKYFSFSLSSSLSFASAVSALSSCRR